MPTTGIERTYVTVSPGRVVLHLDGKCGKLPDWTELRGTLSVLRPGQVEVHVSSVVTGEGEFPVCMEAWFNRDSWIPLEGEGPGGTLKVFGVFDMYAMKSFGTGSERERRDEW